MLITDFRAFGISVQEGYGITECAPLVAVNLLGKERLHSVGRAVPGCVCRIDKKDPSDETGEIVVKGDNVMLGYYRNEEATAEVFTEDGWFRTGDIGYMDADGYIFITGRKKNVIILSNGKNIFPEELEEHLGQSDLILECCRDRQGKGRRRAGHYRADLPQLRSLQGKIQGGDRSCHPAGGGKYQPYSAPIQAYTGRRGPGDRI